MIVERVVQFDARTCRRIEDDLVDAGREALLRGRRWDPATVNAVSEIRALSRAGQNVDAGRGDGGPSNRGSSLLPTVRVARLLGCSPRTVRRRATRTGVGRVIGSVLLFTIDEVEVLRK